MARRSSTVAVQRALEHLHVVAEGLDSFTVECNRCSRGDYVFQEETDSLDDEFAGRVLAHLIEHHNGEVFG